MPLRVLIGLVIAGRPLRDLMNLQSTAIDALVETLQADELAAARLGRDQLSAFVVALDRPESPDELRERLLDALVDMSDQVARLEEQTV